MLSLPLLFAPLVVGFPPAVVAPSDQEIRAAAEKALPFLLKSSAGWREQRKCVTCHQVPFTVWAHNEARIRGLAVDRAKLDDLTGWSLDFCTTDKYQGEFTGGFLSTMAKLALALEPAPTTDKVRSAYEFFEPLIAKRQRPDGAWKEGNFIGVKGAEQEGVEVDTMWTVLGLNSLERQMGKALSEKARASLTKGRERALASLHDAKPGTRTDWLALRMLTDYERGEVKSSRGWRQELLRRQNADGGWPFVKGGDSHPLVTGECLYALTAAGVRGEDPVVRRACTYLVGSQRADGSWEALSRQALGSGDPKKVNAVTVHWGTGWAAIGLLRALPPKP